MLKLKFKIYYLYQDVYVAFTLLVFFSILNLLNTIIFFIIQSSRKLIIVVEIYFWMMTMRRQYIHQVFR
jgi:hypothetical protein